MSESFFLVYELIERLSLELPMLFDHTSVVNMFAPYARRHGVRQVGVLVHYYILLEKKKDSIRLVSTRVKVR